MANEFWCCILKKPQIIFFLGSIDIWYIIAAFYNLIKGLFETLISLAHWVKTWHKEHWCWMFILSENPYYTEDLFHNEEPHV